MRMLISISITKGTKTVLKMTDDYKFISRETWSILSR